MKVGISFHRGGLVGGLLTLTCACGSAPLTTRMVDEPTGEAITYGAPTHTTYSVQLDTMNDLARLVVYQSATCQVLPVTVMQRYEEKVRGDQVVERTPVTKKQVVGKSEGAIVCDQTYARNVEVLLEVPNGGRFPMGKTDRLGEVSANLAKLFQVATLDQVPESATVILRPSQAQPTVDAGSVSFAQLIEQQQRLDVLLTKLEQILAKGHTGASPDEITRSYELYSQLNEIAPQDPRVVGVRGRFWELLYARKLDEATERLGKNLQALSQAQETLKVMGDAAIPIYIQAAVNSGVMDRRSLEWASLRLIRALRSAPAVCAAGFSWEKVPSYGWSSDAVLAAQYVYFAYGSGHSAAVQAACRAF